MRTPVAQSVLIVSLLALATFAQAQPASGPSAHGGGSVVGPSGLNYFGVTANTHPDGSVSGKFNIRIPSVGGFLKMDVQCLDVQEENKATFSGEVLSGSLGGSDLTGLCYVVTGEDHGEGANSPPDLVSGLMLAPCFVIVPESACVDFGPQLGVLEVTGNIQVRP